MLCSINDYLLANGTLSGGYALTGFRLRIQRICDVVVELGAIDPVVMDRNKRRADISFNVRRVQSTIKGAEEYLLDHDATIPRTGDVKLIVSGFGFSGVGSALIINGALISHELVRQIGKFTEHSYQILGAPLFAPTPGTDHITTEDGDTITTEDGDKLILEG